MSACETLVASASAGIAPALRAVDCMAGEMTASAFGRLFGAQGALAPALTILLTLYIAGFAVLLLTGRASLNISALTPRMMTLGLVLTFATSWLAYQGVMWNLATGAPDQIAGVLSGAQGSATQIFADRIDLIFAAIAQAGEMAGGGAQGAAGQASAGSFTPANLMWLAALMLLLGTVGVLVTARIALAVLLAVGPVFIVLGLFKTTRGLTAGWLRGVVMTAVTPLFVVVGGGVTVEMLVPVIAALVGEDGVSGRAALALFLIASVHLALMTMLLKVSGTMVSAWSVFGLAGSRERRGEVASATTHIATASTTAVPAATMAAIANNASPRRAAPGLSVQPMTVEAAAPSAQRRPAAPAPALAISPAMPILPQSRGRGIGSRFRAAPPRAREFIR
ncbi:MAG: type IV secretion system protein [Novosphingobium sp.]|nr:type IV secretion system protein [Novosphingobium sp.]